MKKILLGISLLLTTSTLTPAFSATSAQTVTVIGAQFGDESKGKVTDLLANRNPAAVCRFNGGDNAGHTLVINGVKHKLSLIPSGIFHKNVTCFLGAGTTINPEAFLKEMAKLQDAGAEISPRNLKIAANAPLILPLHKEIELIAEKVNNLNTTKKGIGPSYEDKAGRRAIRAGDLVALDHPENLAALDEKVDKLLSYHNALRRGFGEPEIAKSDVINYLKEISPKVGPFVADVATEIAKLQEQGKKILVEGAQSVWLDISHGTYPFVTSSNTLATAADSGLGVRLKNNLVLGVVKAYTTRVGNGPFPTILNDATGEKIREIGHEFGAVTGRTRDTGWLDLVTLKQMIRMNGMNALVLAKGDVLDGFDTVKVCVGYKIDGKPVESMPYEPAKWSKITPIYKEFKGWKNTKGIKSYDQLDPNYKEFIKFVEQETKLPIAIISTGPDRDETIIRQEPFDMKVS